MFWIAEAMASVSYILGHTIVKTSLEMTNGNAGNLFMCFLEFVQLVHHPFTGMIFVRVLHNLMTSSCAHCTNRAAVIITDEDPQVTFFENVILRTEFSSSSRIYSFGASLEVPSTIVTHDQGRTFCICDF